MSLLLPYFPVLHFPVLVLPTGKCRTGKQDDDLCSHITSFSSKSDTRWHAFNSTSTLATSASLRSFARSAASQATGRAGSSGASLPGISRVVIKYLPGARFTKLKDPLLSTSVSAKRSRSSFAEVSAGTKCARKRDGKRAPPAGKIGRASCRERVWVAVGAGGLSHNE